MIEERILFKRKEFYIYRFSILFFYYRFVFVEDFIYFYF